MKHIFRTLGCLEGIVSRNMVVKSDFSVVSDAKKELYWKQKRTILITTWQTNKQKDWLNCVLVFH